MPRRLRHTALDWFATERPALLAAVEWAAGQGFDAYAWRLAWTFATFNQRRGYWQDRVAVNRTSLGAAHRLGDRPAEAYLRQGLALAYLRLGRHQRS